MHGPNFEILLNLGFSWTVVFCYLQKKHSDPPVSLHGQLLWREFFYTASVGIPNFNKMEGNSVCTQVDWDTNPEHLAAWREVLSPLNLILKCNE